MNAVHLEVLPVHEGRIRISAEILEPRNGLVVAYGVVVCTLGNLYVVVVETGMGQGKGVESLLGVACEDVPVEAPVIVSGTEGEGDVGAVLRRGILQGLSPGNGTGSCKVVGVERCQTLAPVGSFRDSDEVEFQGVKVRIEESLTEESLPDILLAFLPPAVV